MTLREALTRAASQLAAHPALRDSAAADATLLLMHVLSIDRATLLAHPERPITDPEQELLQSAIARRLRFEPIQYVTGTQEFFGLALKVTPAVLIPRPETEILVEAVLARLNPVQDRVPHSSRLHRDEWDPAPSSLRIVDIGTGSGAIGIALAHALPHASVTALDLSPEALGVAAENARSHALNIRFRHSDLLAAIADEPPFDAIVSNPPYIPTSDAPTLHPQVREHEPAQALFAGPTGLEVYQRLIPQAHALLKPGGLLGLEIGYGQRDAIAALLGAWREVEFLPDLLGIPRVALARH
jgi:release factor glutamine methyltransferase